MVRALGTSLAGRAAAHVAAGLAGSEELHRQTGARAVRTAVNEAWLGPGSARSQGGPVLINSSAWPY
uniref:Uncharacterized protein n=1 Tax=Streptomyces sp. FR1 TaxID=349971 RepID=V9Z4R1_9ACTN|nr:hypothetical protein pFRL3_212 [Streptomyces sp. FR1]